MPRLFMGNSRLTVGLNQHGLVNDLRFPAIDTDMMNPGQYSNYHRIGIMVDNQFSWLDDEAWHCRSRCLSATSLLQTTSHNHQLGVSLEFIDGVDSYKDVFMRHVSIVNHADKDRAMKLFFHQMFVDNTDNPVWTAANMPRKNGIIHFTNSLFFVASCRLIGGGFYDEFAVGECGTKDHEGSFRDAEDGSLSGNMIDSGVVDSVMCLEVEIPAGDSKMVEYWISAAEYQTDVWTLHDSMRRTSIQKRLAMTEKWWLSWSRKAEQVSQGLPKRFQSSFVECAVAIKASLDANGAIVPLSGLSGNVAKASVISRDASTAMWPLIRLGYKNEPLCFFDFFSEAIANSGVPLGEYFSNTQPGPLSRSFIGEYPPFDESHTAAVLYLFARFYHHNKSKHILDNYYESLVCPLADFLADYIDETSGLPKPSYSSLDGSLEVSTYTTALVYGALIEASAIADKQSRPKDAVRWRSVADGIKRGADVFYDENKQCFASGLDSENRTTLNRYDSQSLYSLYMYGLVEIEDERLKRSFEKLGYFEEVFDTEQQLALLWRAQYNIEINNIDHALSLLDRLNDTIKDECSLLVRAEYVNCLLDCISRGVSQ